MLDYYKWQGTLAFAYKFNASKPSDVLDITLKCIHIFIITGRFLYWCVLRPASQRFFIHSCIYLRILIISYLATFLGTYSLFVLMCRKAVNQSMLIWRWIFIAFTAEVLHFLQFEHKDVLNQTKLKYTIKLLTAMLILIVCPSLKLRSSLGPVSSCDTPVACSCLVASSRFTCLHK